MRFLCQGCRTKYQVADEKVRGKILTIRCRACGAMMHVRESLSRDGSISVAELVNQSGQLRQVAVERFVASSATVDLAVGDDLPTAVSQSVLGSAQSSPVDWFVAVDGAQRGPFSEAELIERIEAHDIGARHYVWREDYSGWKRLRDVPELSWALTAQRSPAPKPEPRLEHPGRVVDFAERRAEREPERLAPERFQPAASEAARPEDVFQSVPKAHAEVAKENTRFFVEAAGVGLQKSKNKAGLLLGLAGLSVVIAFIAAWATGLVRVSLPGFVGPPQPSRPEEVSEETATDLSDQERRMLKGLSGEEKKRQMRRLQDAPRASASADAPEAERGGGPRGRDDNGTLPIDLRPSSIPDRDEPIGAQAPPAPDVPVPPVDGTLDPVALRKVVGESKAAVEGCFKRERRPITEEIRIEFLVTVRPTGSVSEVVLKSPQFKQATFSGCIADKIKEWKFPAFVGGEAKVLLPFVRTPAS